MPKDITRNRSKSQPNCQFFLLVIENMDEEITWGIAWRNASSQSRSSLRAGCVKSIVPAMITKQVSSQQLSM
jgi:hypothetical protein